VRKAVILIMLALTFYLESTGEEYGGSVIQMDYWKSQDGKVWVGRSGNPDPEMGPNPKYINTRFVTGSNETLIPKLSAK